MNRYPPDMNRGSISKKQKRVGSDKAANEVVENNSPEQRLARGAELADF